jgi:hypothetical protein
MRSSGAGEDEEREHGVGDRQPGRLGRGSHDKVAVPGLTARSLSRVETVRGAANLEDQRRRHVIVDVVAGVRLTSRHGGAVHLRDGCDLVG